MICRPREELHRELSAAFSAQPEIRGIYVFGREVDGQPDEYSDIDMILCSDDLARSHRNYRDVLGKIAPIVGTYLIHSDAAEIAEMVLLEGFSPYQKIDLSISADLSKKEAFGPFRPLYERPTPTFLTSFHEQTSLPDLSHIRHSLTNRLNDVLFGIPRFTKCLFRGEHDFYRRWFGATETLTALLHESYFGWSTASHAKLKLLPHEYKQLFHSLNQQDSDWLKHIHPIDGKPDLCLSFYHTVCWIVRLYQAKAAQTGEVLDTRVSDHLLSFLEREIERFHRRSCSSSTVRR
ncbi:MAG: hypothetical protein FWD61_10950 [Phycisphaerales bacterium]|nr:hypothetical protein [Phycisphaerales bacterium]